MTREEAYNLICELNEEAHMLTYNEWVEADDNEDLLEEASIHQAEQFNDLYNNVISDKDREDIQYWIDNDESFKEEFNAWMGIVYD